MSERMSDITPYMVMRGRGEAEIIFNVLLPCCSALTWAAVCRALSSLWRAICSGAILSPRCFVTCYIVTQRLLALAFCRRAVSSSRHFVLMSLYHTSNVSAYPWAALRWSTITTQRASFPPCHECPYECKSI